MKTQGEAQSEIGELVAKFMQESMGRGPTSVKTNITDDVAVIRLKGVLTETEQHLMTSVAGKDLLISVRRYLMNSKGKEYFRNFFLSRFETSITNLYYDCDPANNEEIVVFVMLKPISFRAKSHP